MKQEYKVKEVFDKNAKTIDDKLKEVFITFLLEKINKQMLKYSDKQYIIGLLNWNGGSLLLLEKEVI